MKKIISMVMAMLMILPFVTVSAEYAPQFEYEAQMLYDFGLFKGTDKGFELDKKCDRLQAAALFVRLLGKEAEALNNPKAHPFTDVPEWASPYVGQMYADGYTKGISATEYGIGDITANQFATFCLRALGYLEVTFDYDKQKHGAYFKYEESLEKMIEQYILRQDSYDIISKADVFLRDYAVKMAYNSLFDTLKGKGGCFLIRSLIENGVIDEELVKTRDIFIDDGIRYLYSVESFTPYFEKMIMEAAGENKTVSVVSKRERYIVELTTTTPQSLLRQSLLYETAASRLIQHTEVMTDDLTSPVGNVKNNYLRTTVEPSTIYGGMAYRCTRYITHGDVELTDKEKQVVEKSKEFLSTITDNMSDYDKFKAAYNYLADNVKYSLEESKSGDIDVLVDGKSVCQGFATTYQYLCRLMGLECWYVGGDYGNLKNHAWNKVKLDGKYYNVDSTGRGQLKYFLFKNPDVHNVAAHEKIYDFPCIEDYKH